MPGLDQDPATRRGLTVDDPLAEEYLVAALLLVVERLVASRTGRMVAI